MMTMYLRPFGFVAPINVPENCRPRLATEIVDEIAAYCVVIGK
jgi:hypothetical protein